MFFVIFWTALVRYTWLSNSSRFFFRQSVLSDVFGLNGRHHWQLRAAAQRCGAGGCRREATWINNVLIYHVHIMNLHIHKYIYVCVWIHLLYYLISRFGLCRLCSITAATSQLAGPGNISSDHLELRAMITPPLMRSWPFFSQSCHQMGVKKCPDEGGFAWKPGRMDLNKTNNFKKIYDYI